jgi:hypothetical protein
MSLDLETRLRTFFASAPQTVHSIQTLQISHSAMSQTFHLWREPYAGVTYADSVAYAMEACNMEIKLAGSSGHLDQKFEIRLGLVDSMDIFREQLDLIPVDTSERIAVTFREYLSDDLTAPQATAILQAESVSWVKGAASITAVSPRLNITRTGELYNTRDIPMLRGFL